MYTLELLGGMGNKNLEKLFPVRSPRRLVIIGGALEDTQGHHGTLKCCKSKHLEHQCASNVFNNNIRHMPMLQVLLSIKFVAA